jgi:hypothetical protein
MKNFRLSWESRFYLVAALIAALLVAQSKSQVASNPVDWGVQPLPFSQVGNAGWQFLKLPTDARSIAIGGIKSAIGYGNANSSFSNPASAVDVKDMDIQFSSMNWVADIRYSSLALVKSLGEWGTIGTNFIYVNYGDMIRTEIGEGYDATGNSLGILPITEGLGTFGAHDLAVGLLYSRQITDFLQVGGTIRYIEEQIDDARMSSWSLDIGTMYWTGLGSLRISMLGKNFGSDGTFSSYEARVAVPPARVRLPMEFILGAAYDVVTTSTVSQHRVTIAAEYLKPTDGPEKYHIGAEYFALSNIYVRGGYRFNYDEGRYTVGFGLDYSVADEVAIKFDYAYMDVGRFKTVHMFTFGFRF